MFLFFSNLSLNLQLPCLSLPLPEECAKARGEAPSPFADSSADEDDWGDDAWGNDEKETAEANVESGVKEMKPEDQKPDIVVPDFEVS